jgi:hypothetical protein
MKESVIEEYLIKRVTEAGGEIRKLAWLGRRNAPDRLVGFPASEPITIAGIYTFSPRPPRHALVELKAPKKNPPAAQTREHDRLRAIGFDVWVLNTKRKVDNFMRYYAER